MCPDRSVPASQRGFLIPSAVFLLVVMAGLAAYLSTISSGQQMGSAQDIGGARAYQAARSGLEWGFYRALNLDDCVTSEVTLDTQDFPGLNLTVKCEPMMAVEGAQTVTLYTITATACSEPKTTSPRCPNDLNPGSLYIERQLEALAEK